MDVYKYIKYYDVKCTMDHPIWLTNTGIQISKLGIINNKVLYSTPQPFKLISPNPAISQHIAGEFSVKRGVYILIAVLIKSVLGTQLHEMKKFHWKLYAKGGAVTVIK